MKKKSYDNYNYNKYLFTNYHNYQISTLDKKKKKKNPYYGKTCLGLRFHVIMRPCRVYRESFKESTIKLSKHLMTLTSFTDILLFLNIIDWQDFVLDTRINRLGVGGTWTLQSCIFYRPLKPGHNISIDSFTILDMFGMIV